LYSSPNIVRIIKPRTTRWAAVCHASGRRSAYVLSEHLNVRNVLEDLDADGRIILKYMLSE
jgi:hypothetical protein